jgi:hypothetical protein
MKYARITPRKMILEVADKKPESPSGVWVEITNKQAKEIENHKDNKKLPIWFEGKVTTRFDEFASGNRLEWNEETGDFTRTKMPVKVPKKITPLQLRKALNSAGLRDAVEAAIKKAPQETVDSWEYATEIQRDNPLVEQLAKTLSLTKEAIDQIFIDAAKL